MRRLLTEDEARKFQDILKNYQPNNSVLEQFQTSNFAVIAGPAGAGKDTLRNALIEKDPSSYVRILSTTTRPIRPGEQEGIDYYFRTSAEVEEDLKRQEFFQTALVHNQQVSCMHINEIHKLGSAQIGLSILVVQTEEQLRELKPDIKTIFLIPENLEVLKQRMQAERVLDPAEIERRLTAAKKEMIIALGRTDYYCLISADLQILSQQADDFLRDGRLDKLADNKARSIIEQILNTLSI